MKSSDHKFMFIFPGQGSHYRGMGSDLCAEFDVARNVYDRASNVLEFDVAELSFRDPASDLDRTEYTQVALLTQSVACLEVFKDLTGDTVQPYVTAGHSVGEYAALAAAEALTFEDALRIVRARACAMAEYGRGRMLALRLGVETVRSFVDRFYCGIGGCNLPNQTVVGGADDDLGRLADFVRAEYGVSAVPLKTEGAFHTYLMTRAAVEFRPALDALELKPPKCRVLSNYSGKYHSSAPDTIKAHLFFQIFNPVRWMWELQHAFKDGVEVVIEFGGGMGDGNRPAEKIPNLQNITRGALKRSQCASVYRSAISSQPLFETARFATAYASLSERVEDRASSQPDGATENGVGQRWFHLYVPVSKGVPCECALELIQSIGELGLTSIVQLIADPAVENVETLRWLGATNCDEPQPYLEVVYASEAAAVVHYFGQDVHSQLAALMNAESAPHRVAQL
jgi:malonyl CoA-acyl carrier protein transacylase